MNLCCFNPAKQEESDLPEVDCPATYCTSPEVFVSFGHALIYRSNAMDTHDDVISYSGTRSIPVMMPSIAESHQKGCEASYRSDINLQISTADPARIVPGSTDIYSEAAFPSAYRHAQTFQSMTYAMYLLLVLLDPLMLHQFTEVCSSRSASHSIVGGAQE